MLKKIADIFWLLSSMLLYFLFFKLKNINNEEFKWFKTISFGRVDFNIDYWWILIAVLVLMTILLIPIYKYVIPKNETLIINSIKIAEPAYVPTYIGYFIIAININNLPSFIIITIILICLIYQTKMIYFNPLLNICGLNFYEVTDANNATLWVISKQKDIKHQKEFKDLSRLNNYVFLEMGGE